MDALLEEGVLKGFARMDLALILAGVFIVLVWGFFTYFHAPGLPFLYDDYDRIVENPALHSLTTVSEGWDARVVRPVTSLIYALNWRLSGGTPGLFHFTNAVVHVLNAVLVFLLCRRIYPAERASEVVCLAPALLFLAHPAFSTPALYISSLGVSLGAGLALATTLFYVGRRRATAEDPPYDGFLTFALVAFTLAWGAHTAVWALPIALAALDLAVFQRIRWKRLAPVAFFAAAFLVVHVATRIARGTTLPGIAGVWERAENFGGFVAQWFDLGLPLPQHPAGEGSALGLMLWALVLFIGVAALRFLPRLSLPLIWTSIFFVSQGLLFVPMAATGGYLAFAGVSLLLPAAITAVPRGAGRTSVGVVTALVVLILSTTTFSHSFTWGDEETLLLRIVESCEECESAADRLARIHIEEARRDMATAREAAGSLDADRRAEAARNHYAKAADILGRVLERDPQNVGLWLLLGETRAALGDRSGARAAYERARLADPWSGEAALRLAEARLAAIGESPSHPDLLAAVDLYRAAHRANAFREQDYARFAQLLTRLGNFEAADEILAAGVDATGSPALRNLQERNAQSIEALRKREERVASLTGRERTLEQASLLHLRRQFLKSSYLIEADLSEHGFRQDLWLLLAKNKAEMGEFERFIAEYRERADVPDAAWRVLADEYEKAGKPEAAKQALNVLQNRGQN